VGLLGALAELFGATQELEPELLDGMARVVLDTATYWFPKCMSASVMQWCLWALNAFVACAGAKSNPAWSNECLCIATQVKMHEFYKTSVDWKEHPAYKALREAEKLASVFKAPSISLPA